MKRPELSGVGTRSTRRCGAHAPQKRPGPALRALMSDICQKMLSRDAQRLSLTTAEDVQLLQGVDIFGFSNGQLQFKHFPGKLYSGDHWLFHDHVSTVN